MCLQELAINPSTFTPEMLINVARIVSVNFDEEHDQVVVRPMLRPGADMISFGMVDEVADEENEGGTDENGDDTIEYRWTDVVSAEWKHVES